jgi:protoporphyrinogen IX oxidase
MLWIKTLHILFVASWFAGLFYLPRIFVNLAMLEAQDHMTRERLLLMSDKLLRFTHLLMLPAVGLGLVLWIYYGIGQGEGATWMHAKLALVGLTVLFHLQCARELRAFHQGLSTRSHVWFRVFNEIPVVLMLFVVALVIHKPMQVSEFLVNMTLVLGCGVAALMAFMALMRRARGRA